MVARTRPQEYLQLLFDGCSISELAAVFGFNKKVVAEKLRGARQNGERNGFPIYQIPEASRYLNDPLVATDDIEAYLNKCNPSDLPPKLMKEFWVGQLSKQKFELNQANLWPTEDVMLVLADVFKKLKTGILLFADTIDAKSELLPKQRALLTELSDALLTELHRTLIEGDLDVTPRLKRSLLEDVLDVDGDGL